tara:strand:- start:7691 stop:8149 length:459 start_codon:yes stop_codon:yes gene_type:complete
MCDPVQIGMSLMKFAEKQAAADAQNKAAREDYFQKVNQTQQASLQTHAQMSDQLFQDSILAVENQAAVYANTEGMGGSLVGRLVRNQRATEARNKDNINKNYEMDVQQKQYEMQGYQVQSTGRMKKGPSLIPVGLEMYDIYNKDQLANGDIA